MKFLIVDKRKRVGNLKTLHYAVQRLQETLDKKEIPHDFCHYDELTLHNSRENNKDSFKIYAKEKELKEYSHVIFRGHRSHYEYMIKYFVTMYAKEHNIYVQNAKFIQKFPYYNKLYQMAFFAQNDLPYLESFYSIDGHYDQKKFALKKLTFPLIYKHTEGKYKTKEVDGKKKLKKHVYLVNNEKELKEVIEKWDKPEEKFISKDSQFFLQKFTGIGEDYRAIMIGGKFFSGWKRVATEGFLTVNKGEYSLYEDPDPEFLKLAQKAADTLEADYCALDIIYSECKPYILEVNMEPGFKSFETKIEEADVDVAEAIIEHALSASA